MTKPNKIFNIDSYIVTIAPYTLTINDTSDNKYYLYVYDDTFHSYELAFDIKKEDLYDYFVEKFEDDKQTEIIKYSDNGIDYLHIRKYQFYSAKQSAFTLDVYDIKITFNNLLDAYDNAVKTSQLLKEDIDRIYKIKN